MKSLNIHIIGGAGAMGNWLKNYLDSQGIKCSVSGRDNSQSEYVKNADIVFISVPISIAPKITEQTEKIVKKNCLLIDLSSTVSQTTKALKKTSLPSFCMHLLFGPNISSIENQKVVFIRVKNHKLIDKLKKLLEESGAQVLEMSPQEHDFQMAHIQALTHFVNLTLAKTLVDNKINLAGKLSTPVFLSQMSVLSRVVSQDPKLITELQTSNPYYQKILNKFLENQSQLIKLINENDKTKLENYFQKIHHELEPVPSISKNGSRKKISKLVIPANKKVGFLGPIGTFSHQAALQIIGSKNILVPKQSFYDIFQSIEKGSLDYGIVPAENSTEGTIRETLDFLVDFDLKTNGSLELEVHQNLLSKEKSLNKITKVVSHPQALAQCRKWLEEYLPNAKVEAAASTLSAARDSTKGLGIIGPSIAAKSYGLNILAKNIEDNKNNITKFYLISKSIHNITNKTLLFLTIFNRVGILRDILSVFADLGINLNKIESRPSREKVWDYYFFIEVEIKLDDPKLTQALNILKQYCPLTKVLGAV